MSSPLLFAARGSLADALREAWPGTAGETWRSASAPAEIAGGRTAVLVPGTDALRPPDPGTAGTLAEAALGAGMDHLILISSTAVHEPSHRHLGLAGPARLRPRPRNRVSLGWRRAEGEFRELAERAGVGWTVLRPAPTPLPGGRDAFSQLLRPGRWLRPRPVGFDPPVQYLALEDLVAAILRTARKRPSGTHQTVPEHSTSLRRSVAAAGGASLPLPRWLLRLGARLRGREPDEVDFLTHSFTADGDDDSEGGDGSPFGRGATPPEADPFGLDRSAIARLSRTLLGFLHRAYWRVEHRGLEHVPRTGKAVLVGIHRGHQPWDGVMLIHLLRRELGRVPRFLVHPALLKQPFLAPFMQKLGGLPACRENAAWVLEGSGLLGIFPEGIRGAFSRYRDAYRLHPFGRDEYVRIALRDQADLVPFVTVGSAEIFPILGKIRWRWWERVSEWPCLPITPTASLLPLPSKWHTRVLPPVPIAGHYPPEAADDPDTVSEISRRVQTILLEELTRLRARRPSIFFGSVFSEDDDEGEAQPRTGPPSPDVPRGPHPC